MSLTTVARSWATANGNMIQMISRCGSTEGSLESRETRLNGNRGKWEKVVVGGRKGDAGNKREQRRNEFNRGRLTCLKKETNVVM